MLSIMLRLFKSNNVAIPEVLNPIGKVGIPLAGTEVKVLDDGELCIKGKHVAKGYYKLDDETKETFDSDGHLHTGDLAEIDDNGDMSKSLEEKRNTYYIRWKKYSTC